MRSLLFILFFLQVATGFAAPADSTLPARNKPAVFVNVGMASEQWVLSNNLSSGYAGVNYPGKAYFIGAGLHTNPTRHPLGFLLTADYLGYSMNSSLKTDEFVTTGYSYVRIAPGVFLDFKSKSKLSFKANAYAALMLPLADKEQTYYQFGLRGVLRYQNYGAIIGYGFSNASHSPNSDLTVNHFTEHTLSLGLLCYPAPLIRQIKAASHNGPVPGK